MQPVRSGSWYDGTFYAWVIDSSQSTFRSGILTLIEPDSVILDVGCGTGGLSLRLARTAQQVTGVDISARQIEAARHRQRKAGIKNLHFLHADILDVPEISGHAFDYAVLSFVIHELPVAQRIPVLQSIRKIARTIIILDYHAPHPRNIPGIFSRLVEISAGPDHFRNFKTYLKDGGLLPLLHQADIHVQHVQINPTRIFTLVTAHSS